MKAKNKFPNGFESWMETHHEIVMAIALELEKPENKQSTVIRHRYDAEGSTGMYSLGKELTNKFEKQNKGREWDGEFIEAIEEFLEQEFETE